MARSNKEIAQGIEKYIDVFVNTTNSSHKSFGENVNQIISEKSIGSLKAQRDPTNWYKVRTKLQNKARIFLISFEEVLVEMYKKNSLTLPIANSTSNDKLHKTKVRYSISKLPDTIIPYYFKHSYDTKLDVIFKLDYNWNQCLSAFEREDIDVALHNFSTVLAYNYAERNKATISNLLFFPFFTFSGYGIVVKKQKIEKFNTDRNINKPFKDWSNSDIRDFLHIHRVSLETGSDIEWVYKYFCEIKLNCNWDIISQNIQHENINSGKLKFIEDDTISILCTNSLHIKDLEKDDNFQIIAYGSECSRHVNYNGLICTEKFYIENKEVIKDLIVLWFDTIRLFKNEWNSLDIDTSESEDVFAHHHLKAMVNSFNDYTKSNISIEDFIYCYRIGNVFFDNANEAYHSFKNNVLESKLIRDNIQIAKIQDKGVTLNNISVSDIDNNTQTLLKLING